MHVQYLNITHKCTPKTGRSQKGVTCASKTLKTCSTAAKFSHPGKYLNTFLLVGHLITSRPFQALQHAGHGGHCHELGLHWGADGLAMHFRMLIVVASRLLLLVHLVAAGCRHCVGSGSLPVGAASKASTLARDPRASCSAAWSRCCVASSSAFAGCVCYVSMLLFVMYRVVV